MVWLDRTIQGTDAHGQQLIRHGSCAIKMFEVGLVGKMPNPTKSVPLDPAVKPRKD